MKYSFSTFIEKKQRVDMYLSALFSDFSRSYVQKMIDSGQVQVNGKDIKKNVKVEPRDEITISVVLESLDLEPQDLNLDVIYEDDSILLVNKDAGINVHPVPGMGGRSNTLVNGVLHHCAEKLPTIGGVERPGIVHRLDKDTSGVIMIAKSDAMMEYLSGIIKNREIDKYYLAVVDGVVKQQKFTIESYIGRDMNNKTKMTTQSPLNPKIAITHGEVIDYVENKYTLVKIKIETGRTHQIRVHMSSIGHQILGDKVYGNMRQNTEVATRYQLKRQALHAYQLEFDLHGKKQKFQAELKDDMKRIIGEELLKKI